MAGIFGMTGLPIIGYFLIPGGTFGLEVVESTKWGGLMLTLILAYIGILASLPIGILLALGRRSEMPIIRGLSVVFIEVWRAVPLITVLFMASVMLPLFLPEGVNFEKLARALIGITLWQSAYMAEVIRVVCKPFRGASMRQLMPLGSATGGRWGSLFFPRR